MAELPILVFPSPETASKTPGHGFGGNLNRPTVQRQGQRLNPVFQQLQNSFDARSVELQQTPTGIDPEQVLVIETIGNVEDFANAVMKIPGLEWMGEFALDGISPDEDFKDEKDSEKKLSGRLYLIMSNQTALTQMLSLWQKYTENQGKMNFQSGEYRGLAKFKDIFLHLKDIRRWSVEDRLAEREVFEIWQEDIESSPQRNVRFEAELWYRGSDDKRRESESIVSELIKNLGGSIISQCVIPSIAYHSILGELSTQTALKILENPEVDLIKCENIMFFRPTGQIATGKKPIEVDLSDYAVSEEDLPKGDHPVVALLDGLPLENHHLLTGRLIIDDPDGWASSYSAIDRQHGTAMASLIVHGDLNDNSKPLSRLVYVRPIMKPNPTDFNPPREEGIPENFLFVDYIHKAIKRIVAGEGDDEAAAPTVKIINLSIGDRVRPFSQMMSPLARLLDWLSEKYNLLFIISSGNHPEKIDIGMSSQDFLKLKGSERESLIIKKIYEDMRHRKLLSPAESINGLTVGALHADNSKNPYLGHLFDPFQSELPSPVSSFGSGYRRSIKPDLIAPGGKVLYETSIQSNDIEQKNRRIAPPGHRVAAPSTQAGPPNMTCFCFGSSNSAALTSRAANINYDYLQSIFLDQAPDSDFSTFGVPILKAALVHGCIWNKPGEKLGEILKTDNKGKKIKDWISKWLGYGVADFEKALGCNQQKATLLGFGRLEDGEAHVYQLPLPPSLNAQREWRRFTVTLAWLSPVASTTQRYRKAQLWFDFEDGKKSRKKLKGKLRVNGIDSDSDATRRGTIQHEVFEGKTAVAISDDDSLRIKVNCRKDAQKIDSPIAYGLVVSLEVAEGVNLPIYNEIRTRITPVVEIPAGG